MSDVSSSSVSFHDAKDSSGSLSTVKDADAVSMPELPGNLDSSVGSCNDQSSLKSDALERRPSTTPITRVTSSGDKSTSTDQLHSTKETKLRGATITAHNPAAIDSLLEEPRDSKKYSSQQHQKKGFLERIGIHRRRRTNDDRDTEKGKRNIPKLVTDQDENASDGSIETGSSSASDLPRKSAESSRSAGLHYGFHSLSSARENDGYVPHGGIPVKVKSKTKGSQELPRVYLAQTLNAMSRDTQDDSGQFQGATWALKFSKDGKYLAAAGQLCTIYVWKVLDHEEQRKEGIKVFQDSIFREYQGHAADILDIAWSKNNFIASASIDKTIRLWHISRKECLGVFRHPDVVPSVCFHPKDDRFILSGSLDGRIRLWSVPDKKVAFWNEVPSGDMVTAIGMTLDGKTVCAGSHTGQCFLYETQGLKYNTQVTLRFSKRTSKKARKITGIEAMPGVPANDERILITSNDSRIRLINMKDKSLMFRYKGASNTSMQIRASFSDDGRNIVCGSDDGNVYIWLAEPITFSPLLSLWRDSDVSLDNAFNDQHKPSSSSHSTTAHARMQNWFRRHEKRVSNEKPWSHSEHFEAHEHVATCAIFAPTRTRQLLAKSGKDIIYNNTLINIRYKLRHDPTSMRRSFSGNDFADLIPSYNHHHHHHSEDISDTEEHEALYNQAKERHAYNEGPILVSANDSGCIKVWRVDSGWYGAEQRPRAFHRKSNSLDQI